MKKILIIKMFFNEIKVVCKYCKVYKIFSKMKLIRNESEIINNLGRLVVAFVSR